MWPFRRKAKGMFGPQGPWPGGAAWPALSGTLTPPISPAAAESLAAVTSCISLISESIAALPAVVVSADDSRATQPNHALSKLVLQGCNSEETWSDLIASLLASTLLRGNALAEILLDGRGALAGLRSLPWEQVLPWVNSSGDLVFDFIPVTPAPGLKVGERRRFLRGEVLHTKDRSDNGLLGISPLQRSGAAVQLGIATQLNSLAFTRNASRPGGYLSVPTRLKPDEAARWQSDWDTNYSGERFGKTAVLQGGMQYAALNWVTAEDAQLVERLGYSVRDVARIFRIPSFLLADETRSTFASSIAGLQYFASNCLRPWCVRLERAFQQSLLGPGLRLSIDLTALLRGDPAAFASALLTLRQGSIITSNEGRGMLNLPPHPAGDVLTPPSVQSGKPGADGGDAAPADAPAKALANGHDGRAHT
jgi:HK97 family phage portal protein